MIVPEMYGFRRIYLYLLIEFHLQVSIKALKMRITWSDRSFQADWGARSVYWPVVRSCMGSQEYAMHTRQQYIDSSLLERIMSTFPTFEKMKKNVFKRF